MALQCPPLKAFAFVFAGLVLPLAINTPYPRQPQTPGPDYMRPAAATGCVRLDHAQAGAPD